MITTSNTNFLPAYNNPHSISLANRVSNDVDIYSPFINSSHAELLTGGLQAGGVNVGYRGVSGLGGIDFTDPATLLMFVLGGVWVASEFGFKKIMKG